MKYNPKITMNDNLKLNGLEKKKINSGQAGHKYEITKDGILLFKTNDGGSFAKDFKAFLEDYEISNKDMMQGLWVHIDKYVRLCPTCYYFDKKSKTCDMCEAGSPYAIDNNGKTPSEVQDCTVYYNSKG